MSLITDIAYIMYYQSYKKKLTSHMVLISYECIVKAITVYFSFGLLQKPDDILKQSRGAAPRESVSKYHRVYKANQWKNITVTDLNYSHAYIVFTLTVFEMDFSCLFSYRNRYLKNKISRKKKVLLLQFLSPYQWLRIHLLAGQSLPTAALILLDCFMFGSF